MNSDIAEILKPFSRVVEIPVHWGDMDALAHVNNVVYFRWLESSRVCLMDSIDLINAGDRNSVGPILASVKCDYRRQTHYPDTVSVGSRVDRIGRSSLTIKQVIVSHQQRAIVAEGEAVLVLFDYVANQSVPISDELRQALVKSSETGHES